MVSRLYQKSIPEQIGDILYQIGHHFVYFTKGLTEMPYEIFVPVFEDTMFGKAPEQQQSGYFDYWGLYFDEAQQHKAMIYSLEKRKLQEEDLFLISLSPNLVRLCKTPGQERNDSSPTQKFVRQKRPQN